MMGFVKTIGVEQRGPGRPRDEEVRKRVLESACHLLEEAGFRNVTMDAVAEQAGASKATLYRWWPDKASLFIEAFRDAVQPEFPFSDTGSLTNDLSVQIRRFSKFLQTRRGKLLAAFVAGAHHDPEIGAALREYWITPLRERGYAVLDRYRKNGQLPPTLDLNLVQDMMYAPLYYNLLTGYTEISEAYVDALVKSLLNGLQNQSKDQ